MIKWLFFIRTYQIRYVSLNVSFNHTINAWWLYICAHVVWIRLVKSHRNWTTQISYAIIRVNVHWIKTLLVEYLKITLVKYNYTEKVKMIFFNRWVDVSDLYVDMSDLDVDMPDLHVNVFDFYVDLSDLYVDVSELHGNVSDFYVHL